MPNDKAKKLAHDVSDALNSLTFSDEDFCEEMGRQHRTLQQSFTRLCIEWFRKNAELKEHEYDGRNEATVKVSKIICEALEKENINTVPYI